MSSTTLLNDLMHKANLDFYSQETLMLIRKFIYSSYRLFSLSKRPAQTDSEFDPILSVRIDNVLIDFYPLHQRLFIELKFSSFRDVVDYFQGIQFHPCFECFDFLVRVPNLMSGLSVDEKQQVILKKESIPYALLKKIYDDNHLMMQKRTRDHERVEEKGYKKALEAYQLFKQKVITTQEISLNISKQILTLALDQFSSFALVLSEIQCIYKAYNRWAKDTNTTLIRKLVLDIETASISINIIALGSGRFNDLIKMDLITGQEILSFNQKIQEKAQSVLTQLEAIKQQYPDSSVKLYQNIGKLIYLSDTAKLIKTIVQLQTVKVSSKSQKVINHYFASIQDPTLNGLFSDLWNLIAKEGVKEQRVFDQLQRIFNNRDDYYHTSLPGLYSFQLVNKHALISDNTEQENRT